tara:strand:- start:31 stop:213 length:183 start_codon:yes stop_codon:yes gene_type:complete
MTHKANKVNPKSIVGKYQIKFTDPNTIGVEIINPKKAFLESVNDMNVKNEKQIIIKIIFL